MVKKARSSVPNQLLRRARLERGWTQQGVADRIGAPNDVLITRWERGTAFPSAYYVERLCQIFEQKASDLGLLREAHPTVAPHPLPRSQSRPDAADSAPQNVPQLSALPLIGRETDLHTLQALYHSVQQGQMQVALIQGEAGIGKTHLASVFLHWAAIQDAVLLQGRAFEMGGRLPYQPLAHALSRHLKAEAALEALLSVPRLSELSRILPGMRECYPSLPEAPGDEMTARIRLFEAVTHLLQAFCARGPVVLFIDDVQWADAASLDVLHYVGQRCSEGGTPLFLLLSLRSEALATTTPFSRWLASLPHDLPVTQLTLSPLTQQETLLLLRALATDQTRTADLSDRFTELGQWLFRETHGQPFYLIETLKMFVRHQALTFPHSAEREALEVDWEALERAHQQRVLAPNVRRLILSQLDRLTTAGLALARSSGILGQETPFEVLFQVADLAEVEALAALSELLGYGLLRETSQEYSQEPSYIFGHDKVREVITTEMGEAQRRLLHRRALTVLEASGRPAAELAHHARSGGLTEQAVRFGLTAGDEAVGLFAYAEASLHYTQVLEALSQFPKTTDTRRLRVETILKLAPVSWMTADRERILKLLTAAEHLARELSDQRLLASVHYWIGMIYSTGNAIHQAREYAEQVLMEAQELEDEELVALVSVQLSRVLILQGNFAPIEELLTPVIPTLERRGRWMEWVYALGCLGWALASRGHVVAGVALGQRVVEHARRAGELHTHRGLIARHILSIIHLYSGSYLQMVAENIQIMEEGQKLQNWLLVYWGSIFESWAQVRLGKLQEAMQSMERVQDAGQRLGGQIMSQDLFAAVRAELLLAGNQVEAALALAQVAAEMARKEVGGLLSEGMAQRVWGQALARLARWEEAEAHLAASVELLLSGEALLEAARTQVTWGQLCRTRGDLAAAQAHFAQAAAQFEVAGLMKELETVQGYLNRPPGGM